MAPKKRKVVFQAIDTGVSEEALAKLEEDGEYESPLIKSLMNSIHGNQKMSRLAFEEDPLTPSKFGGLYYDKFSLLPDKVIKRISVVDDLVATIVKVRGNQVATFGTQLQDRFSTGYRIQPNKYGDFDKLPEEEREDIFKRIQVASKLLGTCGHTKKWADTEQMSFSTFLYLSASNAVRFGRFATELLWLQGTDGTRQFYAFRPTDPATIYKAIPETDAASSVRKSALQKLELIKNKKLIPEKFKNDEYAWVQVIEGTPVQAFASDEMVVHNCYPITDIELNGYPLTPMDTAIAAITTHINITNHNKLYFQSGRASKGMLVIQSEDVDLTMLADLKQQFNAAINSVANSWRMPVIKVGQEDKVEWKPIDSGSKDMEFQYLSDSNCRTILAAFAISPDEVPGYNHLSKGTNNQALSEANNEYKLEAARDVGIRPLLASMEDFLNNRVLPLLDEKVAKYCTISLVGLDADTPEKESTRQEKEQQLHGTYNETLRAVDKAVLPKEWAGDFPLNPMFTAKLDQYFTVGQIKEYFFGEKGAAQDPRWDYARDPFYFQNMQMVKADQQMQQQAQMAEQQMAMGQQQGQDPNAQGQAPAGGGQPSPDGGSQPQPDDGGDLTSGIDQIVQAFSKSEKDLSPNKRNLLARHNAIVKNVMDEWDKESEKMLAELSQIISKNKKK